MLKRKIAEICFKDTLLTKQSNNRRAVPESGIRSFFKCFGGDSGEDSKERFGNQEIETLLKAIFNGLTPSTLSTRTSSALRARAHQSRRAVDLTVAKRYQS